jgi:Raf kinase inhibitor-like YbhB/YbcL family protein
MASTSRQRPPNPYDTLPEVPSFTLTSDELTDGEREPNAQVHDSAGGGNVSPSLRWSGAPAETRAYAVSCFDPDAPTGCGFWHWLAFNLPADVTSLPAEAGAAGSDAMPSGVVTMRNDFGNHQYDGAAPPPGDEHRYFFAVHALDTDKLDVDPHVPTAQGSFNVVAHTIARATVVVTYST